eukprot:m.120233 g.120233  ORF g.120233 m.120233 type:complete len:58 (+) comp19572_c0_seq8:742-915(+)
MTAVGVGCRQTALWSRSSYKPKLQENVPQPYMWCCPKEMAETIPFIPVLRSDKARDG